MLAGKRIIVTGGASGIGAAAAKAFLANGARVAILDISDRTVHRDPGAKSIRCDISDQAEVKAGVAAACEWLGGLDTLVHCAGMVVYRPSAEISFEDWSRVMGVNASGTFFANQAVFPFLRASDGGSIINMGSIAGIRPHAGNAIYSASKGAVMAWSRAIAAEWGPHGIRVNVLAPVANTPMADIVQTTPEQKAIGRQNMLRTMPLGRLGDPEADIAPVLVFLASDASHYMTGQVISVDGGLCMIGA